MIGIARRVQVETRPLMVVGRVDEVEGPAGIQLSDEVQSILLSDEDPIAVLGNAATALCQVRLVESRIQAPLAVLLVTSDWAAVDDDARSVAPIEVERSEAAFESR